VIRLARRDSIRVVAECANGREAIDAIRRHKPHLLFLDVQMPSLDGFGVLDRLSAPEWPHVIFVTAHERYAARAFDVHAFDYLLKPIDDRRFGEALDRALGSVQRHCAGTFPIRQRGRMIFVRHDEIDWIEAQGDYVRLHAGERHWLVRDTMAALEIRLGTSFARIHRSTIVNIDRIREVRSFDSGDCAVLLRDGTELRLSRNYRSSLHVSSHRAVVSPHWQS
jgi:two-component system LytT family response regulator